VHGSDGPETAKTEIAYFFPGERGVLEVSEALKQNLLGLDAAGLASFFAAQGEKPFRARQVQRWIHQLGVSGLRPP
jgi:hypothetical protein